MENVFIRDTRGVRHQKKLFNHSGYDSGNFFCLFAKVPCRQLGNGGTRQAILRKAPAASPGGDTSRIQAWLRQQMEEGKQSLSPKPSAVHGVREAGTVHQVSQRMRFGA